MQTNSELIEYYNKYMPPAPAGFIKRANEKVDYYIFFTKTQKYAKCTCSKCGGTYTIQIKRDDTYEAVFQKVDPVPYNDHKSKCLRCGQEATLKNARNRKNPINGDRQLFLCSGVKDSVVVRLYSVYASTLPLKKTDVEIYEIARLILKPGRAIKEYFLYNGFECKNVWTTTNLPLGGAIHFRGEEIYNSRLLKSRHLKYNQLDDYIKNYTSFFSAINQESQNELKLYYLIAYNNMPQLEMLQKMGLNDIAQHAIWKAGKTALLNKRGKKIEDFFRIKKERLSELKTIPIDRLLVYQLERKLKTHFTEELTIRLEPAIECLNKSTLDTFLKYMSIEQFINRIYKYQDQGEYHKYYTYRSIIQTYHDLIKMREELEYDMTNQLYSHPKNLKETHDKLVSERRKLLDNEHVKKMEVKYPDIKKIYKELLRKYRFENEEMSIRPAMSATEIIEEGRTLHHCVGTEHYLKKHNENKSIILFLRHRETPDIPFITIEINSKGISQWYGEYDRKPKDEKYKLWIEEYEKCILHKKSRKVS